MPNRILSKGSHAYVLAGYLQKKGKWSWQWSDRYFVLTQTTLHYFKQEQSQRYGEERGRFNMEDLMIRSLPEKRLFELFDGRKTRQVRASTDKEYETWAKAFIDVQNKAKQLKQQQQRQQLQHHQQHHIQQQQLQQQREQLELELSVNHQEKERRRNGSSTYVSPRLPNLIAGTALDDQPNNHNNNNINMMLINSDHIGSHNLNALAINGAAKSHSQHSDRVTDHSAPTTKPKLPNQSIQSSSTGSLSIQSSNSHTAPLAPICIVTICNPLFSKSSTLGWIGGPAGEGGELIAGRMVHWEDRLLLPSFTSTSTLTAILSNGEKLIIHGKDLLKQGSQGECVVHNEPGGKKQFQIKIRWETQQTPATPGFHNRIYLTSVAPSMFLFLLFIKSLLTLFEDDAIISSFTSFFSSLFNLTFLLYLFAMLTSFQTLASILHRYQVYTKSRLWFITFVSCVDLTPHVPSPVLTPLPIPTVNDINISPTNKRISRKNIPRHLRRITDIYTTATSEEYENDKAAEISLERPNSSPVFQTGISNPGLSSDLSTGGYEVDSHPTSPSPSSHAITPNDSPQLTNYMTNHLPSNGISSLSLPPPASSHVSPSPSPIMIPLLDVGNDASGEDTDPDNRLLKRKRLLSGVAEAINGENDESDGESGVDPAALESDSMLDMDDDEEDSYTRDKHQPGVLPPVTQAPWGGWTEDDTSKLVIRGPTYLTNKVKIPVGTPMYRLSHVDMFVMGEERCPHVASRPESYAYQYHLHKLAKKKPDEPSCAVPHDSPAFLAPMIVINFLFPGPDGNTNLVLYMTRRIPPLAVLNRLKEKKEKRRAKEIASSPAPVLTTGLNNSVNPTSLLSVPHSSSQTSNTSSGSISAPSSPLIPPLSQQPRSGSSSRISLSSTNKISRDENNDRPTVPPNIEHHSSISTATSSNKLPSTPPTLTTSNSLSSVCPSHSHLLDPSTYVDDDLDSYDHRRIEAFDTCLRRFLLGDNKHRDTKVKIIPRIAEGSWLVKRGVGTTPAILGSKINQSYYYDPVKNYIEIDVDVGSSVIAGRILSLVKSTAETLIIELSFLLQGDSEEELPESLLTGVRIVHPSLMKTIDYMNNYKQVKETYKFN